MVTNILDRIRFFFSPDPSSHVEAMKAHFGGGHQQIRLGEKGDHPTPPCPFWVDVYESPRGKGYVLNYKTRKGVKTYHVGPG